MNQMLLITAFLLSQTLHLERLPITVNRPVDARFAPHTDKYLYICEHFGGYVYRGSALPWLQGQYVWGDYIGKLWARDDAGTITDLGAMATSDAAFTSPVGFCQDKAGELYVIDLAGADLFKLTP